MNPYKTFLDNVLGNFIKLHVVANLLIIDLDCQDYSVQTALDDWLDGLGPVVIPEAVAGREKR